MQPSPAEAQGGVGKAKDNAQRKGCGGTRVVSGLAKERYQGSLRKNKRPGIQEAQGGESRVSCWGCLGAPLPECWSLGVCDVRIPQHLVSEPPVLYLVTVCSFDLWLPARWWLLGIRRRVEMVPSKTKWIKPDMDVSHGASQRGT